MRTGLHPPAERAAGGQRKGAPPLPTGGRVIPPLAGPWLPTQGTCPSQQRGDHTRRPSRALAALPPGNYTLGTGLLPLPGEAGGRARGDSEGQTPGDGSAPPDDGTHMCPQDITLNQHKAAFTPQPVCPGSNIQVLGKDKGVGDDQNCLALPRKVESIQLTCPEW